MATDKKKVSQYLALTKSFAQTEFTISQRRKNLQFMFDWGIDFAVNPYSWTDNVLLLL